jgi:hypothetical protein
VAWTLRVEHESAIYHVTVRANGGQGLFKNAGDRRYLLARLVKLESLSERLELLRSYSLSSFQAYVGMSPQHDFIAYEPLLASGHRKTCRFGARSWRCPWRRF